MTIFESSSSLSCLKGSFDANSPLFMEMQVQGVLFPVGGIIDSTTFDDNLIAALSCSNERKKTTHILADWKTGPFYFAAIY